MAIARYVARLQFLCLFKIALKAVGNTALEEADRRDVKGLCKKAPGADELNNFTGLDSPYEAPTDPEITVNTVELSVEETADAVLSFLESREQVGFASKARQL